MKIRLVTCFILGLFLLKDSCFAQSNKSATSQWHIKTGFGYYDPMAAGGTGNIFFTELGYTLPTKFIVGVGFGLSDVFEEYDEMDVPLFGGARSYHNYYLIRLFLDRSFNLGEHHKISIGTGLLYEQVRFSEPFGLLIPQYDEQGELVGYDLQTGINKSSKNNIDIGQVLNADYSFRIGKISLGIRAEMHYLYAIGFGGLVVAPQLSVSF